MTTTIRFGGPFVQLSMNFDLSDVKTCTKCRRSLPRDNFYVNYSRGSTLESACKECIRKQNAAWRARSREHIKEQDRRYRETNKDDRLARRRALYQLDPKRYNAPSIRCSKKRRQDHPEIVRHLTKKRYERYKTIIQARNKAWYIRNPEKKRQQGMRYNARKKSVALGTVDYAATWDRDEATCYLCRLPIEKPDLHFDHVIPLSRGGPHSQDNIRAAHRYCNQRKGALTPEEYWASIP